MGVAGGKVVALGVDLGTAPRIVNAVAKYVLPGAIDVHTHFEMPFMGTYTANDFRTGTAAAAGGITTVVDWAIQEPGESLFATLEKWDKKAAGKTVIDYSFYVVLTDLSRNALDEIKDVVANGALLEELAGSLHAPLTPEDEDRRRLSRAVFPVVKAFYDGWLDEDARVPFYRPGSRV